MVIQNNKIDDTVNTLDVVAKTAGANAKQQNRQGQTDSYSCDNQWKRGKKITGLSKKEHWKYWERKWDMVGHAKINGRNIKIKRKRH